MANVPNKARKSGTPDHLLFVYGTLMRGGSLHHFLSRSPGARFVGKAKMRAELYRLRGEDYPGAVQTTKRNRFVHGELYKLRSRSQLLTRIDEIEGVDEGLFVRRPVEVLQDGKKVRAWTYLYARSLSRAKPLLRGKFVPVQATA